jgi:hypothetical protein
MGGARVQEVACRDPGRITGRIGGTRITVECTVDTSPLCVVKDVESSTRTGNKFGIKPCAGIPDQVSIRSDTSTVRYPGIVGKTCGIAQTKWSSRLEGRDSGKLPAAQNLMCEPSPFGERQIVHISDIEYVPLVKIRACTVRNEVIRVYEVGVWSEELSIE